MHHAKTIPRNKFAFYLLSEAYIQNVQYFLIAKHTVLIMVSKKSNDYYSYYFFFIDDFIPCFRIPTEFL